MILLGLRSGDRLGDMKPIEVSETVGAPIEEVFAIASDIPNAAGRVEGIKEIEMLSDGPVCKGTRWRETRVMFGKKAVEEMWITAWDPPRGYVVEADSCGCHYRTVFSFDEIGENETRMTMSFGATAETFMAKVMMKVFAGMSKSMAKMILKDLRDIKGVCEGAEDTADS